MLINIFTCIQFSFWIFILLYFVFRIIVGFAIHWHNQPIKHEFSTELPPLSTPYHPLDQSRSIQPRASDLVSCGANIDSRSFLYEVWYSFNATLHHPTSFRESKVLFMIEILNCCMYYHWCLHWTEMPNTARVL